MQLPAAELSKVSTALIRGLRLQWVEYAQYVRWTGRISLGSQQRSDQQRSAHYEGELLFDSRGSP